MNTVSLDETIQMFLKESTKQEKTNEYRIVCNQIAFWLKELKTRREYEMQQCEKKIAELEAKIAWSQLSNVCNDACDRAFNSSYNRR